MTLPAPTFAPVSRGTARRVRRALSALGGFADGAVRRGAVAARGEASALIEAIVTPLCAAGMARVAGAAKALVGYSGAAPDAYIRGLARSVLLARAGADYPDGPAPRALLEAALRTRCRAGELARAPGRVLVPLVGELAWDVAARRLVKLRGTLPRSACVILARRVDVDLGHPVPQVDVRHWTPGVPLGRSSDRRMLRHAESSLARVAGAYAAALTDPLADGLPPILIGPLSFVRRSAEGGDTVIVEDAAGIRAAVRWPMFGECPSLVRRPLHVLATPVARHGHLALLPELAWISGARHLVLSSEAEPTPWGDGLLTEVWRHLIDLVESGLAARFASRAALRAKTPFLRAAGFTRLAALIDRAMPEAGADDALAFATAAHLTRAVLHAPRWLQGAGA